MTRAVQEVLVEIGAGEVPQLLVLSKADRIDDDRRSELARRHADAVLVSAHTGEGIEALVERVEDEFSRKLRDVELLIPYDEGNRLAELHELAGDLEREETQDGVRVRARLPAQVAARYERFSLNGHRQ
jgi:GTP-binding protein HflX